jgi:hypothetical protein
LSLYGREPADHQNFSEHLTAEVPTMVSANGRTVAEFAMRPGVTDNHWGDTTIGAAVAASILGAVLPTMTGTPKPKPKVVSYAAMQAAAKARQQRAA